MTRADCFVSVIAPVHDDGDLIDGFVADVTAVLRASYDNYELVLIDDGSGDDTVPKIDRLLQQHQCVRLLRLSRHFGVEAAIAAGLDNVIGDYVVVMLPESDPVDVIPTLVSRAQQGAGVVYGVCHDRRHQSRLRRLGARLFYRYAPRWFGLKTTRDATLFRVLSRQAVNAVNQIRDNTRYFRLLTMTVGYHSEPFEYASAPRRARRRGKSLAQALSLAVGLVVTQSLVPLRLAAVAALFAALGNVAYLLYAAGVYLFLPTVQPGWTTLSLHSAAMFAVLFVIVAVLAEYVGRVLDESRDRPRYHLLEERHSSIMIADATRRNVVTESPAAATQPDPKTGTRS